MSEELKPCPFCGSDDIDVTYTYIEGGVDYYAECTDCYCRGAWEPTPEKARAAWNSRPIEDKLQARIEALEWLREVEAYRQHCRERQPRKKGRGELVNIWFAALQAVEK